MNKLALIIDDEPGIRELLDITMKRMGVDCYTAENLTRARELLNQHTFDICLTDMKLPDGDGVEFVSEVQRSFPRLPIAVITAHGSMDSAIVALKSGAFDFLSKPVDLSLLRTLVKEALKLSEQYEQTEQRLIGESSVINELRKKIDKLSRSQAPVYISGESGTGKELVAKMIHEMGPRSKNTFVPVNCGAIPLELMESEFFGHKKGSFTGAVSDKDGLFQAAEGGTLFLDEIADLPQNIQVKLLRSIQEKSIRPIGSQQEIPVNVRILSATHHDLAGLVDNGGFRKDLFYRINVIEVKVLPLRERRDDIPLLVSYIMGRLLTASSLNAVTISDDALERLKDYSFPGNVRELENILERSMTMCEKNLITVSDIGKLDNNKSSEKITLVNEKPETEAVILGDYLEDVQKDVILDVLNKTKWNRTAAAKQLGITLRALRYRLEKLGIK